MLENRHLLAFGELSSTERNTLSRLAASAAFEVHCEEDPRSALTWLEDNPVNAMLIDGDDAGADVFAVERRAETRNATLPVMTWVREVDDLTFADAFAWGADDVVSKQSEHSLLSRLRNLPKEQSILPRGERGLALVADSDRSRRIVVGRVLRNAGYQVTFAVSKDDLKRFSIENQTRIVVSNTTLIDDTREVIEETRQQGNDSLWIIAAPPKDLRRHQQSLIDLEGVTVTDAYAPAENVLFVANELSRPRGQDKRATARLLYGSTVAFRGAGRDSDDLGYTYNLSEGGLYVRTLAPPDDDSVWLELRPPRSERRVRLVGEVVWRRGLAKGEFATVPPGFGVKIVDGAKRDHEIWNESYRAFASMLV